MASDAKEKAIRFRTLVEDRSFFAKMQKRRWSSQSSSALTFGSVTRISTTCAVYDFWLKVLGHVKKWERTKFSKVNVE